MEDKKIDIDKLMYNWGEFRFDLGLIFAAFGKVSFNIL